MHIWTSPDEIAAEFGFEQYASDTDSLRTELKKLVASLHPDRNGGSFASEVDETKFLRAKNAMDFLDAHSQSAMAMIPVAQLPAVVSAVAQALSLRTPGELISLQSSYMVDARQRISRQLFLPKLGSGVFAAITGFLVAFPDKFEKHPLLGPLLQGHSAQYFILALLCYSALAFALIWYKERVAESDAEFLMSESALGELFDMLSQETGESDIVTRVSSRQILDAVAAVAGHNRYTQRPSPLLLLSRSRLDLSTIEKAAAIQTQRLVERRVLSKIDAPSLDTWYEVNTEPGSMKHSHSVHRTAYGSR